jgi:hypothetical protein
MQARQMAWLELFCETDDIVIPPVKAGGASGA